MVLVFVIAIATAATDEGARRTNRYCTTRQRFQRPRDLLQGD